ALARAPEVEVLHRVGDEGRHVLQARIGKRPVQDLARRADERGTLGVLDVAGLLAYQQQGGARRAVTEDGLSGVLIEIAPTACAPSWPANSWQRTSSASARGSAAEHLTSISCVALVCP